MVAVTAAPVLVKLSLRTTVVPPTLKLPAVNDAPPESFNSLFCTNNVPELDSNPFTVTCGVEGKSSSRLCRATSAVSDFVKAIFRILWLPESEKYRFVPSVVMSLGKKNFAEVPVESVDPDQLPARVVTTPVDITIFRIL